MNKGAPKILLVGLGRFGTHHLGVWQALASRGIVEVVGAVVASYRSLERLAPSCSVPLFVGTNPALLEQADAVDIVTPAETHYSLAMECLRYTNVLVEKPLATSEADSERILEQSARYNRLLMVNHLYRYHPVVRELKNLVAQHSEAPLQISGAFLNPVEPGIECFQPNLEMLHLFDIVDYLLEQRPQAYFCEWKSRHSARYCLVYPGSTNAVLDVGWDGNERIRTLEFDNGAKKIEADLLSPSLLIRERTMFDRRIFPLSANILEESLVSFANLLKGASEPHPDGAVGARIVQIAVKAASYRPKSKPRIAIIGGGIFGATCAVELAANSEVTLFERHSQLLTEASYLNQWRHHSGFHYPRSLQTVQEIQKTRTDFNTLYADAVLDNVASYYCTSIHGTEITRERYLGVCVGHELSFTLDSPPAGILDESQVDLCLRTDEASLDCNKLRQIAEQRLSGIPEIRVQLAEKVLGGHIAADGSKLLSIESGGRIRSEQFDYVINATYANNNLLANWFGFPIQPLRFDLCEMLLIKLPIPLVSVTILDGPFTSIVSTGEQGLFLLSQSKESVLRSIVPPDGLPPNWGEFKSNSERLVDCGARYLPILRDGEILESRFSTRAVAAFSEDVDGRPTIVRRHGFGCWSILGGKIATCVTNAREIAGQIACDRGWKNRPDPALSLVSQS